MHDINYIRENSIEFDNFMKTRGENPIANKILDIDKEKRETQTVLQNLCVGFVFDLKCECRQTDSKIEKIEKKKVLSWYYAPDWSVKHDTFQTTSVKHGDWDWFYLFTSTTISSCSLR